jgi:hypothetical protein
MAHGETPIRERAEVRCGESLSAGGGRIGRDAVQEQQDTEFHGVHTEFHGGTMKAEEWTSDILNAAFAVHSALGPGMLESAYEGCLDTPRPG